MSFSGFGKMNGARVVRAADVANIESSASASLLCSSFSAASISSFSQPMALAFRFSKGQCSSVSRMNARREFSEGL